MESGLFLDSQVEIWRHNIIGHVCGTGPISESFIYIWITKNSFLIFIRIQKQAWFHCDVKLSQTCPIRSHKRAQFYKETTLSFHLMHVYNFVCVSVLLLYYKTMSDSQNMSDYVIFPQTRLIWFEGKHPPHWRHNITTKYGDCSFSWYLWNCWPSLFKLSFYMYWHLGQKEEYRAGQIKGRTRWWHATDGRGKKK
jgi:hypothetical protein